MKVLNFGSLNYDFVYKVDHMILAGETLDTYSRDRFFGGKGLNQSMALSRAGVEVYHAGMVGADGQDFIDLCEKNHINTKYISKTEGPSGHTIIQLDKNAQNSILLFGGSNRQISKEYIDNVLKDFEKGDIILLQNEVSNLPHIIDKAYEIGMTIVLNPSPYDSKLDECDMSKVSVFLVNEIEGGQITGETDPDKILDSMLAKFPNSQIVLTLGSDGVVYRDKDKSARQGIFRVKAVDTTAAGDTFTGYFIASMTKNYTIEDTLRLCAKASAIAVTKMGAAESIPHMEEVLNTEL